MINRIKIRKITKIIELLESKLIENRRTLYKIYDGIEILLNNMGEINKERFQWCIRSFCSKFGLFNKDMSDESYFQNVLIGIGLSKSSIKAYLHGFLNTYIFEQYERTLVNKLNDYDTLLKLLRKEFLEFVCWNCKNKIEVKEIKYYKCELCGHYPMYQTRIYNCLYSRDFITKELDNKDRFKLLNLSNKKR